MTDQEADRRAKDLWGRDAFAETDGVAWLVGVYEPDAAETDGWFPDIKGVGQSWEEAFADATAKGVTP